MITTCIFDLDGTLVNSLEDLANTTNILLQKYQYPTHPITAYQQFVGDGIDMLLQRAFGNTNEICMKTLRKEFDVLYHKQYLQKTKPYDGIIPMLTVLKNRGIHVAVVTNKAHEMATLLVETLFPNTFAYVYGNSQGMPHKPDPTIVNTVIQKLHSQPTECVFIGDSDVDIMTGKNAKMKTIGVAWGFRGRIELENSGADVVIDTPEQIGGILNDWC